ncbi:hypothetical protein A4A49_03621 [Nicotiana attenuata]|uniref:Uncharacterized protein n=1 Tax=Nicotiana attenuata TaxID=49451 RepID=A0A314LE82_NICAT|nr:hypothetical protein A4A49_03621 [Nicotiana attenuata]
MRFRLSNQPWPLSWLRLRPACCFSLLHSLPLQSSCGIAFDIDGVILRGRTPIGNSPSALRRLYDESGNLKLPFLFLTNGGGIPESKRAAELSELLGVKILPAQVVQGHSPFRNLLKRYENELIVVTGKGEPAEVMSAYGFKKVLSLEEYTSYFDDIDPVAQFKRWTRTTKPFNWPRHSSELAPQIDVYSDRVKAVFVASDPVDWGRDIQVLCDILTSGGLPGKECEHQPYLYFAADDLEYQAGHPWFSILTRTGVFKERGNHAEFPADLVVDTVEEAVDFILKRESS